jgi:hypothetical protein
VAIDQDTIIVGSLHDVENDVTHDGSAYVFTRNSGVWTETQKLIGSDAADNDWFGEAVALQGDTAVIEAKFDINSGSFGNGGVYIFSRQTDGLWVKVQKLAVANNGTNDNFGEHVAIDGQTVVIGESYGNEDKGAAYVYVKTGDNWTLETQLLSSKGAPQDEFWRSVDVSGDTVVGGVPGLYVGPNISGYAVVFQRTGNIWDNGFELRPGNGFFRDEFGDSVAIDGDPIVVDNGIYGIGEASYVFQQKGTVNIWTQIQKLNSSGIAVVFSGNIIISDGSVFGCLPDGAVTKVNLMSLRGAY